MDTEYRQTRPFRIYVLGPHENTNRAFFGGIRAHASQSGRDQIEDLGDYAVKNTITVLSQPRPPSLSPVRYVLTEDWSLVNSQHSIPYSMIGDRIDAYIVVFRYESGEDFSAIYDRIMKRVVDICDAQFTGVKKSVFIVAHRYMETSKAGFHSDDMRALKRSTHAVYRCENLNNFSDCGAVMDMVLTELTRIHAAHHLGLQTRGYQGGSALAQMPSLVTMAWTGLQSLVSGFLPPICGAPVLAGYSEGALEGSQVSAPSAMNK